jgi:TolB-like protein
MNSSPLTPFRLNGREIDLQRGLVSDAGGGAVTLRPQAAEVLKVLAQRPGTLVTKEELMQAVWPNIAVTDDSLVQCITEIRKAIGDDNHAFVQTVPRRGYVLDMASRKTAARPAIAVLPFRTFNADEQWARFADGLTEDIITDLARFRDIPVIARRSSELYRDKAGDVRAIGTALNVKYVLSGSLQIDGHRLRVTAQLISAVTGEHVWSERYDRLTAQLFDVRDEISSKIAATLTGWEGQLSEAERVLARRKSGVGLDAYDYWLLGVEARNRMSSAGQAEARDLFAKGLALAPDFAPLIRDMGITYAIDIQTGGAADREAALEQQGACMRRALALDPNDALTCFFMGSYLTLRGDGEAGDRYYQRALELGPNNADVLVLLAWTWSYSASPDRGAEMADRAVRLNPHYPFWWNSALSRAYFHVRAFEKAYVFARSAGAAAPNEAAMLAMVAARLGRREEAAQAAASVMRSDPDWTVESMYGFYLPPRPAQLLSESAALAGLPVCMTAAQLARYKGATRFADCDAERAKSALN